MSKYNNKPVTSEDGYFASQKEYGRWQELKALQRAGIISHLERQKTYELWVNGVLITKYIADYAYWDQQEREVVEDVKGFKTRDYRIKAKLMIACYGLRVIEV